MWFKIDSASRAISYGDWRSEKPEWETPSLNGFKTRIVNDGRESNGEHWWFIEIQIKNLADMQRLIKQVGHIVFYGDRITVYDDYLE